MSEQKLLGSFGDVKVFADGLEISGQRYNFPGLRDVGGLGRSVTFKFNDGRSRDVTVDGEGVESASNLRIMAWRALMAWKKDHNAGSCHVVGY